MLLWYLLAIFVIILLAGVGLIVAMSFSLYETFQLKEVFASLLPTKRGEMQP